jgi:glycosyltransferase involved in cell wall biosynthesis
MQALEISRGLQQRGHRVLLAAQQDSRLAGEAADAGVAVLPLNAAGYAHPLLIWKLRQAMRAHQTDVIHCQHSRDLGTVVPAKQLSRLHPPLLLSKRVGSYISKKDLYHRYIYREIRMVLAISEVIRKNVINTTPVPPERVMTFHDAVDTVRFSPGAADHFAVRRELGIADESLLVGFVGRFSPGKGVEELLHAAQMLRASHPDVRYLIVGEASHGEEAYAASIHRLAAGLGLGDLVIFSGYRSDVPAVMASFDMLAFPSHAESFGVVLIEAMAMEKPVVSTNCDGVLDIVVDGETGIRVPPKDAPAFARGLEELMTHAELRDRYGAAGRRRVLEHFDQGRQLQKLEEIYRTCLPDSYHVK